MASNIEIKARVADLARTLSRASQVSGAEGCLIVQRDTFFNCMSGRLKLREFADGTGQLISYDRPDALEPTQCEYRLYPTQSPTVLRDTLMMTLECCGEVKKNRYLFISGRTRIHVDDVEGLGSFLELEVVLESGSDQSTGVQEAEMLMEKLGVAENDLVRGAYIDLISEG